MKRLGTSWQRWRGSATFVLLVAGLAVALRVTHLVLPEERDWAVVEQILGDLRGSEDREYEVLLPFYRPRSLGTGVSFIARHELPEPRVLVLFKGERFLVMQEWESRDEDPVRVVEAGSDRRCLFAAEDGRAVRLCSDLSSIELRRVYRSLRAVRDRR